MTRFLAIGLALAAGCGGGDRPQSVALDAFTAAAKTMSAGLNEIQEVSKLEDNNSNAEKLLRGIFTNDCATLQTDQIKNSTSEMRAQLKRLDAELATQLLVVKKIRQADPEQAAEAQQRAIECRQEIAEMESRLQSARPLDAEVVRVHEALVVEFNKRVRDNDVLPEERDAMDENNRAYREAMQQIPELEMELAIKKRTLRIYEE